MRYCPRSLVVAVRPVGWRRRRPFDHDERIALTAASATGSPNSSMIRPAMTDPFGITMSTFSTTCASVSSIGLPDSNGRV